MKQIQITLSLCLTIFLITSCQSQITITKEFDDNEYICSYQNFEGVNLYSTFDTDNNEVKIYNSNHQLQSSFIYHAGVYFNLIQVYGLSKDVFNNDSNVEFLISKVDTKGITTGMDLVNDQGVLLQEFKNFAYLKTIGNKNYFVESFTETYIDQNLQLARMKKTDTLHELKGKFRKFIF